ncbi:importin subunit beta-3 [Vanrija albida]|uniref:Importin subunit beta-3 n=1 Tax=Vanrija albida TaxID=181172 RepID=A0ABR3PV57_9TREE
MSTEHLLGDVTIILDALIGVDNSQRQEAEARLGTLVATSPAETLLLLAQIGALGVGGFQLDVSHLTLPGSTNPQQRLLSLILLRRLSFQEHAGLALNPADPHPTAAFDVIPEQTRTRIERVLGAGLEDEMDVRLRKGLGVCVGEWVKASNQRQRPFALLPTVVLTLAASPHPFHRFTPFQLLDSFPGLLSDESLGDDIIPADKVAELLLGGINDPSVDVRIEALKATRGVLQLGLNAEERSKYGPALIEACFDIIPPLPLNVLEHALEPMVDLSASFPDLFRSSLLLWVPFLLMCISPPETIIDYHFSRYPTREMEWEEWCQMGNMAYEVLLALIMADPGSAVTWEDGLLIRDIVGSLIGRQIAAFKGDTCEDWLEQEDLDDEDETYPAYPEEMLERLSHVMKDDSVVKSVAHHTEKLLQRQEWQAQYCSLMAIASISEGSAELVKSEARSILELISPTATATHPRVRYGFLFCIGQLCSNLEGLMQNEYTDAVLDVAHRLLDDRIPRVREAAAAALVHFFEAETLATFEDKLESTLSGLITALQVGPLYVQEQALAAIATIATHAGKAYLPYYRKTMDLNLKVLASDHPESHQRLVGRSMRCAVLIGQAVGKEHFFKDAIPLCQALLKIQNQITSPDDKRKGYVSEAWMIIAGVIGTDFAPFLQFILPPVLHAASYVPTKTANGLLDDEDEDYDKTNSAEMLEKEEAFGHLAVYVHEMRAAYAPWLSPTMQITVEAIAMNGSEGLLEAACYLIPGLLQVAKDAKIWIVDQSNLEALFRTIINAIPHQYDASGVGQLYQSLGDSLRVLEVPLPPKNTAHLCRATLQWLGGLYERRLERATEAQQESERGDYWLWEDTERYEEKAENEALVCMDQTFGRVVKHDQSVLASCTEVMLLTRRVQAAAYNWDEAPNANDVE